MLRYSTPDKTEERRERGKESGRERGRDEDTNLNMVHRWGGQHKTLGGHPFFMRHSGS